MKLPLEVVTFLVGLIGIGIGILIVLRGLKKKSSLYNLPFNYKEAFLDDWFVPAINFGIILVEWLVLPYRSGKVAEFSDIIIIAFFGVTGILGNVLLSSGLSVVKKRFEKAIDYKSDVADGKIDPKDREAVG